MDIVISFCSCWWNNGNDVTLCGNCKTKTKIPVYVEQAAELVVAGNTQLNKDSLVIMGSKSGDTKETVAAAKWCKERGIRIASMVIDKESPLGQLTDYQLPLVVFKGLSMNIFQCLDYSTDY